MTVIMETTDLGSVLGIVSGVSGSLVMVCIAIGLTARFRHRHPQQTSTSSRQPPAAAAAAGQASLAPAAPPAEKQLGSKADNIKRGGESSDEEDAANPDLLLGGTSVSF